MSTSNLGSPVPQEARQGRSKQRWSNDGERLVAGCIPVRLPEGASSRPEDVKVMLISSRNGGWVFPKGGWENDETVESAAMRETVEEAGVRGRLEEPLIGTFSFGSQKHAQYRCCAYMFVLHVAEELDVWPERERERCWVSMSEASLLCRYPWMRDALHMWMRRNGWDSLIPDQQQACSGVSGNGTSSSSPPLALPGAANGSMGAASAAARQPDLVHGESFDSTSSSTVSA